MNFKFLLDRTQENSPNRELLLGIGLVTPRFREGQVPSDKGTTFQTSNSWYLACHFMSRLARIWTH